MTTNAVDNGAVVSLPSAIEESNTSKDATLQNVVNGALQREPAASTVSREVTGPLTTQSLADAKVMHVARKAGVVRLNFGEILKIAFLFLLSLFTLGGALPLALDVTTGALTKAQERAEQRAEQTHTQIVQVEDEETQAKVMNALAPVVGINVQTLDYALDDAGNKGKVVIRCTAPAGSRSTTYSRAADLRALREHRFEKKNETQLQTYVDMQILHKKVKATVVLNDSEISKAEKLPREVLSFLASAAFGQGHGPISTPNKGDVQDPIVKVGVEVAFDRQTFSGELAADPGHVTIEITHNDNGTYTIQKSMTYTVMMGGEEVSPQYTHTSTAVIRASSDKHGYEITSLTNVITI